MATINKIRPVKNHEGAKASKAGSVEELRRTLMSCLLWEDGFYESGVSVADRIKDLVSKISKDKLSVIAVEARVQMKLRHAPLWLCRWMAKEKKLDADILASIIQRPDEITEFMALYWKDGKAPIAKQVKKGMAIAFGKFDEYQFAKYNRDTDVKFKDVLFMVHPKNVEKQELFDKIVKDELKAPDTWEVALSSGENKKTAWERLLCEKKLGALALLRNLRNMRDEKVAETLIFSALENTNISRVLPFRFIAAAKYAPQWEDKIEKLMFKACEETPKLPGKTVLLMDCSGSMFGAPVSKRSELDRFEAGCGLAIMARELCENVEIFGFHNTLHQMPARRGFALRDALRAIGYGGTYLGGAIKRINDMVKYDRIIIITDEQSHDSVGVHTGKNGYILNVATYQNGVSYGQYTHINGWSENVLRYITEYER